MGKIHEALEKSGMGNLSRRLSDVDSSSNDDVLGRSYQPDPKEVPPALMAAADRSSPQPASEHKGVVVGISQLGVPDAREMPAAANRSLASDGPATDAKRTAGDTRIRYSRTKIQALDSERMKENKIFSISDDIELTDQVKILRTQVLKKLADIGGNSLLVTSANPYEGKTFTSINLGVSIAKEFNRTVLIIDADLRKPTKRHMAFSSDFFTLDVAFGLTDFLKGDVDIPDILINPGIDKLTLIPSGKPVNNAPELLSSGRMNAMMADIRSRYPSDRLIIVDGPALLPFPDALILSRYVDGVLPVVEAEKTPVDQLKKMLEILKETRVFGTVMNKHKG
jgi:protein-tyrosine kinase